MESQFVKLKSAYEKIRKTNFSNEQFASLLSTYPPIAVCAADLDFSVEEKSFLKSIAKALAKSYRAEKDKELLAFRFYTEFDYLLHNKSKWDKPILKMLSAYLKDNNQAKDVVKSSILGVAEISDGTSKIEQTEINRITKILNL
ncbi:MAG: hypothetical protein IT239_03225 [Bacteroidia bacterium]|nr:hypothetical protein [Bacteroidia bacterium]